MLKLQIFTYQFIDMNLLSRYMINGFKLNKIKKSLNYNPIIIESIKCQKHLSFYDQLIGFLI